MCSKTFYFQDTNSPFPNKWEKILLHFQDCIFFHYFQNICLQIFMYFGMIENKTCDVEIHVCNAWQVVTHPYNTINIWQKHGRRPES